MKQIKKFSELNKASKVRRINNIRRHNEVPDDVNDLYDEYMNNGKDETILYAIRDILLQADLSDIVKQLLI